MNPHHKSVLRGSFLLVALFANAVTNNTIRITVLDSETRSASLDDRGVPRNCDAVNFDAYCHNSKTTQLTNTLLVQEGSQPPFRVACTVGTKWSRCAQLPKGRSFESRREKKGLVVYYEDDQGKVRKQLYSLLASDGNAALAAAPVVVPAAVENSTQVSTMAAMSQDGTVKCSFRSTPTGAEVTLDGRFVGSTPSTVKIIPGTHGVLVALPGFAQWKRDLTVSAESELTVNAILEKEK